MSLVRLSDLYYVSTISSLAIVSSNVTVLSTPYILLFNALTASASCVNVLLELTVALPVAVAICPLPVVTCVANCANVFVASAGLPIALAMAVFRYWQM